MATPSLYVKAGDERPTLEHTCTRGRLNPQPVDLTDADSAHLFVQTEDGDLIIDAGATIAEASDGIVEYDFAEDDLFEPGQSDYEFVITWSDGDDETFPKQGYGRIVVDETLNRTIPASELGPDDAEVGVLTANEVNTDILGPNTSNAVTWDGDQDANGNDLRNAGSVNADEQHINQSLKTPGARPTGQPHFHAPGAWSHNRSVGTIAIETDDAIRDGDIVDTERFFDRCYQKGIPFGIAAPASKIGDSNHVSWGDLEKYSSRGAEIALHPEPISDVTGQTTDDTIDDVVNRFRTDKEEFEQKEIPIHRMVTVGKPDFQDLTDFETEAGMLSQYLFNNIRGVASRIGDSDPAWGEVSGGSMIDQAQLIGDKSQATVERMIDNIARTTGTACLYLHPNNIGTSGYLTWAEVDNILDKVQTMRNNGDLNVVTPSRARFLKADCHDQLINPVPSSNYSEILSTEGGLPATWVSTNGATVNTTTTKTRGYSFEVGPSYTNLHYRFARPPEANLAVVEAFAREKTGSASVDFLVRSDLTDKYPDLADGFEAGGKSWTVDGTWTKIQAVLGLPRSDTSMRVRFVNNDSSNTVLIADEKIYYV